MQTFRGDLEKSARLQRQSLIVCWIEAPEANGLFSMFFPLQWLMRKHPKVNTCPFGWRIPAVALLNNPQLPPPVSYSPVHCGMTNMFRQRSPGLSLHNRNCFSLGQVKHQCWITYEWAHAKRHVVLSTLACPCRVTHSISMHTLIDSFALLGRLETLWMEEQMLSKKGGKEGNKGLKLGWVEPSFA